MITAKQLSIRARDYARNHKLLRGGASLLKLARTRPNGAGGNPQLLSDIDELCGAARLSTSETMMRAIEERIDAKMKHLDLSALTAADFGKMAPDFDAKQMVKAVVLKPYVGPREKGVIFFSADYEWTRLLALPNLKDFTERYTLVLSPGWSPPHCLIHYVFPAVYPEPFFSIISNVKDLETFLRISPKHVMVPLFASSWVNPAWFTPLPRKDRDIDLIMVANFGTFKRHHALFRAMQDMPKSLRITLVGQDHVGRTEETIHQEARAFGVDGRFEVVRNAKHPDVMRLLCRAKASVILSVREGSCVVVAESMFADTPAALLHDAEIGSRAFVNAETGRTLMHGDLGAQLTDFIARSDGYNARDWAIKNISCFRSTQILNEYIQSYVTASGQEWTRDIYPHHWAPDPGPVSASDKEKLLPEYQAIRERYGITLGRDVLA
jgi:glycosyltransferase involved in cell wall biosynthesis